MPCKTISARLNPNDIDNYQLCTATYIIFSWFQALNLLKLSNCNLRDADSTTLPIMTIVQACKTYASAGLITSIEACNCNAICSIKKCRCQTAI
ncbi:unnamed protein product, partial [Rotaria sp. Silwood2]